MSDRRLSWTRAGEWVRVTAVETAVRRPALAVGVVVGAVFRVVATLTDGPVTVERDGRRTELSARLADHVRVEPVSPGSLSGDT